MTKVKVLITHSYFYRFDPKQWKSKRYYPPLGTLLAAAVLEQEGAEVIFHDNCLSKDTGEVDQLIRKHQPDVLLIYDDGFNYLTKMCLTNMREAAFDMIRTGKQNGCSVAVCSSDSTDHYENYLEKGADYILLGEGEETLKELYRKVFIGHKPPASIKGLVFLSGDHITKNPARPVLTDLDSLPLPAWHLADVKRYKDIWMKNHGYFSLNMATTRGCPYDCSWCAKPIYGRKYNSRSPNNVVDEMEFLIQEYGVNHFWICDDIFGLEKGWTSGFRRLVEERELRFSYTVQSRADLVIRDNVAEDMAKTGADVVWLGAESGSQKILDAMNKGQSVEQIKEARIKLQEHGIKTAFFIQFGYLGEDVDDIRQTIQMIQELMPDDIGVSVSYPLPGTAFHEQVKEELEQKANWTDSNDLALMYENTFPPDYYRKLHHYVHMKFRKKQRINTLRRSFFQLSAWNSRRIRDIISILYYAPSIMLARQKLKRIGEI